jgi:hypothetical protein
VRMPTIATVSRAIAAKRKIEVWESSVLGQSEWANDRSWRKSGRSCANGVFEIVFDKEGRKWSQRAN